MNLAANLDPVMVMRRRALRKARGRRRLVLLASSIGVVVLAVGYYAVRASPIFNVRDVTVTGADPKVDATIQTMAEQSAEGHSLLAVNAGAIQSAIEAMPAVRSATVDRQFPNALSVSVVMYHPAVAVSVGSRTYLVADDAHVIGTVKKSPKRIVSVELPAGAKLAVGADRHRSQSGRCAVAAALDARLVQPPVRTDHRGDATGRDGHRHRWQPYAAAPGHA